MVSATITDRDVARAKQFLFGGFDAVKSEGKRKPADGLLRSEDAELTDFERRKLLSGQRDLRRNFTIAAWMIRQHLNYVTGFSFQSKTGNKDLDKGLEAKVAWYNKRENFDRAGRHGQLKALRIAEACRTIDGDVLAVRLADGRIQWVEGDRIRDTLDLPESIDRTKLEHGLLLDDAGATLAYCIARRGRRGFAGSANSFTFDRMVPAGNAFLHACQDNRFDQVRGISPLATAYNELRDTYEVFDYARCKAKVAQLFGLVIYREALEDDQPGTRLTEDGSGYEVDFGKGPVKLELDPGDKAEFLETASPSSETQTFTTSMIAIALKALDIPFSFYDESFTTYSGARGALLQYDRSAMQKRGENKELLDWQTGWRLTLAIIDNEFPGADPLAVIAGMNWIPTGMPWIDPLKEILSIKEEIAVGLNTRTRACRERGLVFEDIVAELKAEAEMLSAAGLPLNYQTDNALIAQLVKDDAPAKAAE